MLFLVLLFFSFGYASDYKLADIIYTDKINSNESDSSQNIKIINSEKIRREKSLSEVLRNIPGINVKRSSGISTYTYRGLPSRYSLVLVNGNRVLDSSSVDDSFDLSSIDISQVNRIEILSGTSALAYGSSAVSGVINIITDDYVNEVSTTQGFRSRYELNTSAFFDNISVRGGLFYEEQEKYSVTQNTDEKDLLIKKGVVASYEKEYVSAELKINTMVNQFYNQIDAFQNNVLSDVQGTDTQKDVTLINASYKTKKVKLSQNYFHNNRETNTLEFNNPVKVDFNSDNYLSTFEFQPINDLVFGYNLEAQKTKGDGNYSRTINSFYSIYENETPFLRLSGAFRVENSESKNLLTYSVGLRKEVLASVFKLSFADGYKRPSLYQLFSNSFGNEDLLSEETRVLELSYQYGNFLYLSLFQNEIKNVIGFDNQYENQDEVESKGVELKIVNSTGSHRVEVSSTLIENSKNNKTNTLSNIPSQAYNVYLVGNLRLFKYDLRFNHVGQRREGTNNLSAYNIVNLGLMKKVNTINFRFSIFNALNQSYQEAKDYNRPGRNYEIELSYLF